MNQFKGIIFLDVDGVLNYENFYRKRGKIERDLLAKNLLSQEERFLHYKMDNLCPDAINILEKILLKCNLGIVLSSSWRGANWAEEALARSIPSWRERFIDRTREIAFAQRGIEIQDWLVRNDYRKKFVIIDDDADMENLMPFLFQTTNKDGLTEEIADKVIKYFLTD